MDRIQELEQILVKAKEQYYNTGKSDLTDDQYDLLEDELYSLNPNSFIFNSVGIKDDEGDINLIIPALSTLKALNDTELTTYWNRFSDVNKELFVVSEKVDGMASHLEYVDGILVKAATRGDGLLGKNILDKVKFITSIPKVIPDKRHLIIRGEIHLNNSNFIKLQEILEQTGEEKQANPRNSTAGLLNAKEIIRRQDKLALLSFSAYGSYIVGEDDEFGDNGSYVDQLLLAKDLGFFVVDYLIMNKWEINRQLADTWISKMDHPCDGIVVRANKNSLVRSLGRNNKAMFGVVAIKPKPESVLVTIKEIYWSQGSKELTPVAIFEPILLDGAMISRAALHSVKNILDLDALPGRTVRLVRSGGVIPRLYHRDYVE